MWRIKKRSDEINELTKETNHNELIYQIEGNTARKRFDGLSNGMEHLK